MTVNNRHGQREDTWTNTDNSLLSLAEDSHLVIYTTSRKVNETWIVSVPTDLPESIVMSFISVYWIYQWSSTKYICPEMYYMRSCQYITCNKGYTCPALKLMRITLIIFFFTGWAVQVIAWLVFTGKLKNFSLVWLHPGFGRSPQ